jgi:DNA-binding CsgD family transcriptional regulator
MSMAAEWIYAEVQGRDESARHLDGDVLVEALGNTLDTIAVGVIIVAGEARILHANQAARRMLALGSPVVSVRGCLGALRADLTKELRSAITEAQTNPSLIGPGGIGIPLLDKDKTATTAHVLPLCSDNLRRPPPRTKATAAVFVAQTSVSSAADIGAVARIFRLTPAEVRLLQRLIAGDRLTEAAAALGIAEATARTHRNHIFTKTGVSRRADLLALIDGLVPPFRRPSVTNGYLTRTV